MEKDRILNCKRCSEPKFRSELQFSRDCQGITYRLVCLKCMDEICEVGYDGEYYDSRDEQIEDDY